MSDSNELVTDFLRECDDNNIPVIAATEPMTCSDCGKEKETRPYGKDGAWVCFSCGMKDEENAKVQFKKQFGGGKHKAGTA
jgi:ribosomal protein L37AE/L43A